MRPAALAEPTLTGGLELAPETVLPSQFFDRADFTAALQPERRLMLAVLEEAVATFQRHARATDRAERALFDEAAAWFASDATAWPYAFLNICQWLGLDEGYIRRGLRRWSDAERTTHAAVYRFPFRRVGGARHRATGRPVGLRKSA